MRRIIKQMFEKPIELDAEFVSMNAYLNDLDQRANNNRILEAGADEAKLKHQSEIADKLDQSGNNDRILEARADEANLKHQSDIADKLEQRIASQSANNEVEQKQQLEQSANNDR